MAKEPAKSGRRAERLAQALKANLKRRKAQAKARQSQASPPPRTEKSGVD